MPPDDSRCLFSIEQECQTTVEASNGATLVPEALPRFLEILGRLAPSLPGDGGLFNAYGRVYVDINYHLEFSALEMRFALRARADGRDTV